MDNNSEDQVENIQNGVDIFHDAIADCSNGNGNGDLQDPTNPSLDEGDAFGRPG